MCYLIMFTIFRSTPDWNFPFNLETGVNRPHGGQIGGRLRTSQQYGIEGLKGRHQLGSHCGPVEMSVFLVWPSRGQEHKNSQRI